VVQKYIALILALMLSGLTAAPAFAGDYMNLKLLPHRIPFAESASSALASSAALPPRTTFSEMAGALAFAPPQTGQGQPAQPAPPAPPAQPAKKELTTKGKIMKWVGIGLMASGGIDIAAGAAVSGSSSCNGNSYCTTVNSVSKGIYYGSGGACIGVGAILLIFGLRNRE